MGLLDKSRHSARKLKYDRHCLTTTDHNFSTLRLLGLLALTTAGSLIMQLFFACSDLRLRGELIEQSNGGFVVVCSNTGLRRCSQVFNELEDVTCCFRNPTEAA